jgi:vancomycin resistance protein YoaR
MVAQLHGSLRSQRPQCVNQNAICQKPDNQPSMLLPFFESTVSVILSAVLPQERELWAAVLTRALDDLAESKKQIARNARAWFFSPSRDIASFNWVCHHLELDPSAVRRELTQPIFSRQATPSSLNSAGSLKKDDRSLPQAQRRLSLALPYRMSGLAGD